MRDLCIQLQINYSDALLSLDVWLVGFDLETGENFHLY